MMQGDSYKIPVEITLDGVTLKDPQEIEIMIGNIRKTLGAGEVTAENGLYYFALSQEESFRLRGETPVSVRVLLNTGDVIGTSAGHLIVDTSLSKVVLLP